MFSFLTKSFAVLALMMATAFSISSTPYDEGAESDAGYFQLEMEEISTDQREVVQAIIPTKFHKKLEKLENSDFLTIQQLVKYGNGNFPKTNWNCFRFEAWEIALRTKERYPSIGLTELQIYDFMMKTFRLESGFLANAATKLGTAQGIFQCTASNRKRLGFPKNWLKLSPIQQLPYYEKYLFASLDAIKDHSKICDRGDFYMINFMPAYADAADTKVLARHCGGKCKAFGHSKHFCAYHANKAFDLNKDGKITKGEVHQLVDRKFKKIGEITTNKVLLTHNSVCELSHMLLFNVRLNLLI